MRHFRVFPIFLIGVLITCCSAPCYAQRVDNKRVHAYNMPSRKSDRRISTYKGLRTSQYAGQHHLVGLYVDGAYSSFLHHSPVSDLRPGGWGTGAGLVYEYQNTRFYLQTGVGVRWQDVYTSVADTVFYRYQVPDAQSGIDGVFMDLQYDFHNRTDRTRNLSVQVPLLFGVNFSGGYCMAGVKLNYALIGDTRINALGTTRARYDRYMGTWEEMDNHGYRKDVPLSRMGARVPYKFDVMASAEVGYEFTAGMFRQSFHPSSQGDVRFRIGAFVDCGMLSITPAATDRLLYQIPDNALFDFPDYQLNHVFTTDAAQGLSLHNFFVGLRFTVLYSFQGKEECLFCFDRPKSLR